MSLNRIWVDKQVDSRLRNLKARTGLTPNLLCRLGFCLSLTEPGTPDPTLYADGQVREFNRYTLTGQWDLFFLALLRERLVRDKLDPEVDLEEQFKAHLSRGVMLLYQRLRSMADIPAILLELHACRLQMDAHRDQTQVEPPTRTDKHADGQSSDDSHGI